MSRFELSLRPSKSAFLPGESVEGALSFNLDAPAQALEVRLVWFTMGQGTQDVSIVDSQRLEAPQEGGELPFRFQLPAAPHSFSGKLISLVWAVEALVLPVKVGGENARVEFLMAPEGREIELPALDEPITPGQQSFSERKAQFLSRRNIETSDSGMQTHK